MAPTEAERVKIHCPDGAIFIDAKLFCGECRMAQIFHENGSDDIMVDSNRELIEKIKNFIMGRAERAGKSVDLTEFSSEFRETNKGRALELIIAAFEMEIKSLIDLMLKDIDAIFTQMSTDEEAYEIFPVNFNNKKITSYELKLLREELEDCEWAFVNDSRQPSLTLNRSFQMEIDTSVSKNEKMGDASKDKRRAAIDDDNDYSKKLTHNKIPRKENMPDKQLAMTHADSVLRAKKNIDRIIKLLKVPFREYRTTLSAEERLEWLTAHFLINRSSSVLHVEKVLGKKGILRLLILDGEKHRAKVKERQAYWDGVNKASVHG